MTSRRFSKFVALTLFILMVLTMMLNGTAGAAQKNTYTVKVENGIATVYKNGVALNAGYPIGTPANVTVSVQNGRFVLTYTDASGAPRSFAFGKTSADVLKFTGKIDSLTLDKTLGKTAVTLDAKAQIGTLIVHHKGSVVTYGKITRFLSDGGASLTFKNKSNTGSLTVTNGGSVYIEKTANVSSSDLAKGVKLTNKNPEFGQTQSYVALPSDSPSAGGGGGGGGGYTGTDAGSYAPISVYSTAVVNATTVTVTMPQYTTASFVFNGTTVPGTYSGGKYTLTVPTITATSNTLVISAINFLSNTQKVTVSSSVGNLKLISTIDELNNAITNQADGESWIIKAGTYKLLFDRKFKYNGSDVDFYFPIHESITISGEGSPLITSDVQSPDGNWNTQDFITVFADNVTIQGINIRCKDVADKAIEILGKNFTLKNVNVQSKVNPPLPNQTSRGEIFSGSIYFNPCTLGAGNSLVDQNDVGNVLLENVTLSAWIAANAADVSRGTITLRNVTNDFRNNFFANMYENDINYAFGPISKNNSIFKVEGLTIYVDNKVLDMQAQVLDKLPKGTKVIFEPGTYYVKSDLSIPTGIDAVIDPATVHFVIGNVINAKPGELSTIITNLKANETLLLVPGTYTIASGTAQIGADNIHILGAGIDKTIINVSNAAAGWGIVIPNSALTPGKNGTNAYLEGFTINRPIEGTNNIIKVCADGATLKNIKLNGGKGLDINPAKNVLLDGVQISNSRGASIAMADGATATIQNSSTTGGKWGSVGMMEGGVASSLTVGANNSFGEAKLYSEKYSTKGDQIHGLDSSWLTFLNCETLDPDHFDQFLYVKELPDGAAYVSTATGLTKCLYTVQGAINASSSGDIITITSGTYDINAGLSIAHDVSLIGRGTVTLIADQAPATRPTSTYHGQNPIVWIDNANVTIRNLTIQASGIPTYSAVDGITAANHANVTLDGVTVTNILNVGGNNGMQYGRGYTGREGTTTLIKNCTFSNFNKNGVHFYGDATATIENSTFVGSGKLGAGLAAQNGIVFHNGATGTVKNCTFSNLWYDTDTDEATGVLSYGTGSFANVTNCTFIDVELPIHNDAGGTSSESGNSITYSTP